MGNCRGKVGLTKRDDGLLLDGESTGGEKTDKDAERFLLDVALGEDKSPEADEEVREDVEGLKGLLRRESGLQREGEGEKLSSS